MSSWTHLSMMFTAACCGTCLSSSCQRLFKIRRLCSRWECRNGLDRHCRELDTAFSWVCHSGSTLPPHHPTTYTQTLPPHINKTHNSFLPFLGPFITEVAALHVGPTINPWAYKKLQAICLQPLCLAYTGYQAFMASFISVCSGFFFIQLMDT